MVELQPSWVEMLVKATAQLPVAVSLVDVSAAGLPLMYVNDAWEALTGYGRSEALGQSCRLLQGAQTEEAAVGSLVLSIREAKPCQVRITNYKKGGTPFCHDLSLHPVHDSNKQLRFIIGVSGDTDDRAGAKALALARQLMPMSFPAALQSQSQPDPKAASQIWDEKATVRQYKATCLFISKIVMLQERLTHV